MSLVKFEAVPITYPSTALLHPIKCAINKTKPIVFTKVAPYELVVISTLSSYICVSRNRKPRRSSKKYP